ncbi:uncharacterized protein LOC125678072 [Ostrea edulis]|uniref:uncharacterized protein LOC125678072 n=1 Tax=Ostrea edulis TaxID=37623 RepID=UPI0024AFEE1E|nr:uncharacterized protein LOC125678072 [Ostrea edulis]
MANRYFALTVVQLKKELACRNATTQGRKIDLVRRLEAYDRNANFQQPPVLLPDPLDVNWPTTGFQQLNSEHRKLLPSITREQIEAYFLHRLAGDNEAACDIKAVKNGELLYQSERVLACSVIIENDVFFTGIVSAAMKNKVTYSYKLRLEKESGDVLNSHCECPAGKGPNGTCKHLAACMIMLENFIENGEVAMQKSCTENLMMFNKPKASHKGSPVKVEKITIGKRKSAVHLDDPRPEKFRNVEGMQDRVRNLLINYTSNTSEDIAFRYLYERADLKSAIHDHHYLSLPFTEYWVDKALQVTESEVSSIEKETRGQSTNKRWFAERMWRITASNFGQISRMTDRRNKQKLCKSLISIKSLTTPAVTHGKSYEKKAIKKFEDNHNIRVHENGLFICSKMPFLGATPDGVIDDKYIIEVKCPYKGRKQEINTNTMEYFTYLEVVGGEIKLKISSNYYDQIQGQLYISSRQFCYFIVYTLKSLFVEIIEINRIL